MLNNIYDFFLSFFKLIRIQDVLDILIVTYVIYNVIRFVRSTRSMQLIKGIIVLLVTFQVSAWLNLYMINYVLRNAINFGIIALLIIFQPELRSALERIGRTKFKGIFNFDEEVSESEEVVRQVCIAAENMSASKTGALIVIERHTRISDIIRTGVETDSNISAELLENIFVPNTPLHDGAVIIRGDRIIAASCVLPLTQNPNLSTELGTRHRAALGITESSDALVVVVSEETGKISLAIDGTLTRNLNSDALGKALLKFLSPEDEKTIKKFIPWKGVK